MIASGAAAVCGFADTVHEAQGVFRALLQALARPGTPTPIRHSCRAPSPMPDGMAAIALALVDEDTRALLHAAIDQLAIRDFLRLRTGVAFVDDPQQADFAFANATAIPPLDSLAPGDVFAPHCSTTLVVGVDGFTGGLPVQLAGPGIEDALSFRATGLDDRFWAAWDANAARFPLGVDILLVCGDRIVGLPRTTHRC